MMLLLKETTASLLPGSLWEVVRWGGGGGGRWVDRQVGTRRQEAGGTCLQLGSLLNSNKEKRKNIKTKKNKKKLPSCDWLTDSRPSRYVRDYPQIATACVRQAGKLIG